MHANHFRATSRNTSKYPCEKNPIFIPKNITKTKILIITHHSKNDNNDKPIDKKKRTFYKLRKIQVQMKNAMDKRKQEKKKKSGFKGKENCNRRENDYEGNNGHK